MVSGGLAFGDGVCLYRQLAVDEHAAVAQHGQLLGGDLLERLAEVLGVVEPDRSQHGRARGDHVGGVQPSSEPRLDHADLDLGRGERDEGRRGQQLELGHRPVFARRAVGDPRRLLGSLDAPGRTPPRRSARPPITIRSRHEIRWGET